MARPARHRRGGAGADGQRDHWQFLMMTALRIAAIILEPLLDRWYGGDGSGRHL